ncbi:ribosomal protein L20 [Entomoplasma freundtii]|uniref:Large ribosomal subunit protein bL20 n=1 Tax=Entomoplasma freundtii TaxID=74700 RepID=A0A2K8NR71_9MOLU|nr:50S ribosomal protein L20 [Entomoplasma freundtii]TDY56811.1 ribosomal protein L20 [Entomoplasma freundtii]
MARVKFGKVTRSRRKRWIKRAKGYYGLKKSSYKKAHEQVVRSMAYAFVGRKEKKRDFRKLWIARINAAVRPYGLSYSRFMHGLKVANVDVNRKMLSELAINNPQDFEKMVNLVQTTLNQPVTHPDLMPIKVPTAKVTTNTKVVTSEVAVEPTKVIETVKAVEMVEVTEVVDNENQEDYLATIETKYAQELKPKRTKKTTDEAEAPKVAKADLSLEERSTLDGSDKISESRDELEKHAMTLKAKLPTTEKALLKADVKTMTKKEIIKYMRKVSNKLAK